MKKTIKVFAPASVTNVGCGFDVMGFALEYPGDEIILKLNGKKGVSISKITGDKKKLPLDPAKNTAGRSLISMVEQLQFEKGVEVEIHKKMPLESGLGSSAASAVAGVFALNKILDEPFNKKQLLDFALEGEKLTCGGTSHADNVAACLYGGFIIVRSISPIDIININTPKNLFCTIVHPQIAINTADTRKILKKHILLSDAVKQWGNVAGLVAGLILDDYDLIGRSIQDVIIEPIRSLLIPGFDEIKKAALNEEALGCSISGSGPSIFAFSKSYQSAVNIGNAMKQVLKSIDIQNDLYISKINQTGPKVIN